MSAPAELLLSFLVLLGGFFGLLGSYGLLKLKDPVQRLHAPTKATTLGVGAALVASALNMLFVGPGISWHELLVTAFLFLTAPLSALFLAKTHLLTRVDRKALPDSQTGHPWATFDTAKR